MKRLDSRLLLRGLLVVFGLAGFALGALVASSSFARVTRSAELEDVFTDAAELPPDLVDQVVWADDPATLERQMEPLTRTGLTSAWLRAWEQVSIVSETGQIDGVEVYFSGSARESVISLASSWGGQSRTQLGHDLELTFYSLDGQIIGLTATESRFELERTTSSDTRTALTRERFDAVLVLEDGNWRIHHLVRRDVEREPWVPVVTD